MKPSIILTGDSHLGALKKGVDLLPDAAARERFVFWPLGFGGAVLEPVHRYDETARDVQTISEKWTNRTYSARTIGASGEDAVLVVSLPFQSPRFLRNHDWAGHAPWHLATGDQIPLSDGMLLEMVSQENRHALAMVRDLKRVWPRTMVIESPRPMPDHPVFQTTTAEVIRHIDMVYRAHARKALADWGVSVIGQPAATIGPEGLTLPAFDHEDPKDKHHANADYGSLVLREVIREVDSSLAG